MDALLYWLARMLLGLIQALPLTWVARLGRTGGGLFYYLDARHRRVARDNLRRAFPDELSPAQITRLARENFRRIGENFACAAKTAVMTQADLYERLTLPSRAEMDALTARAGPQSCVVAVGHFGNFELYPRLCDGQERFQSASTYRGLHQPGLDRLLQRMREKSGCLYFERRRDAALLRAALNQGRLMLGLLADQHAGDHGLPVPFFGRDCSTSAAPAILALRYHCPLYTAICLRTGLARWRIEFGPEIPTRENGRPRDVIAITRDINHAFEVAVRRDPANWFWVHRRWKTAGKQLRLKPPHEPAL